jgi:hypothetical protein
MVGALVRPFTSSGKAPYKYLREFKHAEKGQKGQKAQKGEVSWETICFWAYRMWQEMFDHANDSCSQLMRPVVPCCWQK